MTPTPTTRPVAPPTPGPAIGETTERNTRDRRRRAAARPQRTPAGEADDAPDATTAGPPRASRVDVVA
jgi:hypothetical protein